MAVVTKHHSARLDFTNASGRVIQSLTRIKGDLTQTEARDLLSGINNIVPTTPGNFATSGIYTVSDELTQA